MVNRTRAISRTCACGTPFSTVGTSGRKRCDDCQLKARRAAALAAYHRQRAKQGAPARGDTLSATCLYCPATFTYVLRGRPREICDECKRAKSGQARANWVEANPASVAAIKRRHAVNNPASVVMASRRKRLRIYGITAEWEAETLQRQGGRCGNRACGAVEPGGRWSTWNIDHDHRTGQARGLLCSRCNKGVGLFDDDEAKLLSMVEYVRQHRRRA